MMKDNNMGTLMSPLPLHEFPAKDLSFGVGSQANTRGTTQE